MKKGFALVLTLLFTQLTQAQFSGTGPVTTTDLVGIGVTNPSFSLDVGSSNFTLSRFKRLGSGGGAAIQIENAIGTAWSFGVGSNNYFGIYKSSESFGSQFIILDNGNFGIGETTPDFPLQIRTPNETTDPISFGLDITRVNNGARGLSFGMATDNSYSVIGAHNADLKLGHTFNTGAGGQPIFYPDITIKHSDQAVGRVGIGTSEPSSNLDVRTSGMSGTIGSFLSDGGISSENNTTRRWSIQIGRNYDKVNRTVDIGMVSDSYGQNPAFYVAPKGIEAFRITSSGKVGIGTTDFSGDHKLRVEGSIGAREIKVEASGWSDFVFESDYELLTLREVEDHIAEKGHLPEIPSEAEVTDNGINLGEMDAKLLMKIEELTLYLIEQNKQNQAQQSRIEQLEKELKALKN